MHINIIAMLIAMLLIEKLSKPTAAWISIDLVDMVVLFKWEMFANLIKT